MNALIINCSPVRNGATAEIVHIVSTYLEPKCNIRSICIDDFDIQFCKGCRACHKTAKCIQNDDVTKLMSQYEWADIIVSVSPSYWADVPGQFKVFIDRCTPWCDTHEPHATIGNGKNGYSIVLRTGPGMSECERVISSIEHFMDIFRLYQLDVLDYVGSNAEKMWQTEKMKSNNSVYQFSRSYHLWHISSLLRSVASMI